MRPPPSTQAKAQGARPGHRSGRAADSRDRRRRGGARRRAVQRRPGPTARRATTTTRSSCTRATLAWDGDKLIVHDATQMHAPARAWSLATMFGHRRGQVHVTVALRRRRLRRQEAVAAPDPGGRGVEAAGRPVRIVLSREGVYRVVGGRTATEQRVALGAERATAASTALIHTGTVAMTAAQRPARAVHLPGALPLRRRQHQAGRAGGRPGHARQHVHARAGRVGRHLRAGVRDRRARRQIGIDPIELASATSPTGIRPPARPSRRGTWSKPIGRAPSASAGTSATRSPAPAARASGSSAWACATATYPYYRMPGRCRADHAHPGRPRQSRDRGARDGHGHRPPCRRRSPPSGWACRSTGNVRVWRLVLPRRGPGRRIARRPPRSGRAVIAAQRRARRRAAQARRQRLSAGRPRAERGRRRRRWPREARRAWAARELCLDPRARSA